MPGFRIPIILLAVAFSTAAQAQLFSRKNARVITNAWASPEFVERRASPDGPARLTYHILQGEFFGGNLRDKSLETFPLIEIAETLAADMEAQNLYSASSTEEGDLLIIVHWGVTSAEQDLSDLFPDETGDLDEDGAETRAVSETSYNSGNDLHEMGLIKRNALLTGLDKALNQPGLTSFDYNEIREQLREERYFVILMAYDWQKLLKEKKKETQFVTRFSIPAIGTNFERAIPSLSRAAIPHIGTNLDELDKTKTQLGWGKASVGELEVIKEVNAEELQEITSPKK